MFIRITLLAIISTLFFQCEDTSTQSSTKNSVPNLLERPSKLADLEWDNIQNKYQESILKIEKNPKNSGAYIKIAEVFMHEARVTGEHGHYYPSALKVLDKALEIETVESDERFNALLYKASVMLSQHEFKEAKELAIEAMKLNPYNAQLYGTLVDAHVELGEYDLAVKMADKMTSIRPDIRSYSRVSYLREIHGDLQGAIDAMKLAAESGYPGLEQTAWAKLTLGELYIKNNETDLARQTFKEILEQRPNYPFATAALGKMALDAKNYTEAESLLNEAANVIPEVGYYMDLAILYKELGRTDEYKNTIFEIEKMLLEDVDSGHNMNMEYAHFYLDIADDPINSLKYAQTEFDIRPKNVDVNAILAKALIANGKKNEARNHLETALTLNKKSSELLALKKSLASI